MTARPVRRRDWRQWCHRIRYPLWDFPIAWVIAHLRELASYGYVVLSALQSYVIAAWVFHDYSVPDISWLAQILIWTAVVLACAFVGFLPIIGILAAVYAFVNIVEFAREWLYAWLIFAGPYWLFIAIVVLNALVRLLMVRRKRDRLDSSPCRYGDDRVPRRCRYLLLQWCIAFSCLVALFILFSIAWAVSEIVSQTFPELWSDGFWNLIMVLVLILALLIGLLIIVMLATSAGSGRARMGVPIPSILILFAIAAWAASQVYSGLWGDIWDFVTENTVAVALMFVLLMGLVIFVMLASSSGIRRARIRIR